MKLIKNRLTISAFTLAAASLALLVPQQGGLGGSTLNNCALDLRASSAIESQIYWKEYVNMAEGQYGAVFSLDIPQDNKVRLDSANANSNDPQDLDAHTDIRVRVYWDTDDNKAWYRYTLNGGTSWSTPVENDYWGSYEPLGPFVEPDQENVDSGVTNKKRVRVFCHYRGIKLGCTLTDI